MHYPEDAVFVTGMSKVSKEDAIGVMYHNLSVSLVIDIHTNRILNVFSSMVMKETSDYICQLLVGKNFVTEMEWMEELIRRQFLAFAQKALIAALHDAQNRYCMAYPEAKNLTP